jgi:ribonuclease R
MKKYYLKFYEQQTRKLNLEQFENVDLQNDPYLHIQDEQVVLKSKYLIGKIDHKRTFGFLRQEIRDVYIEGEHLLDAMHDDVVIVEDGFLPKIVEVIKRALHTLVAVVYKEQNQIKYVSDIYIDRELIVESDLKVASGHVVKLHVTKITKTAIEAKVVEILGHKNDPDIETLKIVASYEWPKVYPKDVLEAVNQIKIDHQKEKAERLDLTNDLIFTIDGKDAKDLDDAISIHFENDLYYLGVHIADVSHYVKEHSPLDEEALKRGTSAYLADRVIPMLPHTLSNDLCSLNPHEDKIYTFMFNGN